MLLQKLAQILFHNKLNVLKVLQFHNNYLDTQMHIYRKHNRKRERDIEHKGKIQGESSEN